MLYEPVGSFTHRDSAGAQRLYFTGRVHGHKLPRGSYRLQTVATYVSGEHSGKLLAAFTISG
jgi:hypothetical protein